MSEITRRDHYICALLAGGIPYQLAIMQADAAIRAAREGAI